MRKDAEFTGLLRHDRGPIEEGDVRALAAQGEEGPAIHILLRGEITDRSALDGVLDTIGQSEDRLIRAAYLRYGTDAFLRMGGNFALALWDADRRTLVLARDPSGSIPLHVHRTGKCTFFGTHLAPLLDRFAPALDDRAIRAWIAHGLWPAPEKTAFAGIESVPAGSALLVEETGRSKRRTFYTFSPPGIPRGIGEAAARAELDGALEAAILRASISGEVILFGEPITQVALAPRVARHRACTIRRMDLRRGPATLGRTALLRASRLAEHPLPLTALVEIARVLESACADVVGDWGARELFGATPNGLAAFIRSLARRFEADPNPATLAAALRDGLEIDRASPRRILAGALMTSGSRVFARWSKYLPEQAAARVLRAAEQIARKSDPFESPFDSATGDMFTDCRFAEIRDPIMQAKHAALAAGVRERGNRLVLPFLDPQVIELVLSLPRALLLDRAQCMRLLGRGGTRLREPPRSDVSLEILALARSSAHMVGGDVTVGGDVGMEDHALLDRLAGLTLFGEAWIR